MLSELIIYILFIILALLVGVILYLRNKLKISNARANKYYKVIINFTRIVNGCIRCKKIINDKRKTSEKTRL